MRLDDPRATPDARDGDPLTAAELPSYLRQRRVSPAEAKITVSALGGGISNTVLLAEWEGGAVVVKQPLAQLRVDDEWTFDRARVFVERDCMATLAGRLPGSAPEVVFSDDARYVLGMTLAPCGGVVWRDEHDAGRADPARTQQAARLLGRLHASTAGSAELAQRFADQMPLIEGRIDPYHRTAAARHPDLAPAIGAEIERLLATRLCLVHGDYSPKNLIAYPDRMLMIDFEVAHYGDPAFDVAFLLALVLLDGMRHDDPTFAVEARRFWNVYREAAGGAVAHAPNVVAELACILLARIDGKSRLPLPVDVQRRGREHARRLLAGVPLEDALAL